MNFDLLFEATIVMTIELEVEELCRMTVDRTPIISPVMGFWSSVLSENTLPGDRNIQLVIHLSKTSAYIDIRSEELFMMLYI